jgi:hypothetical protein
VLVPPAAEEEEVPALEEEASAPTNPAEEGVQLPAAEDA